ncbi:MAG: OmpA family protein, partial [Lutibacter sp.]
RKYVSIMLYNKLVDSLTKSNNSLNDLIKKQLLKKLYLPFQVGEVQNKLSKNKTVKNYVFTMHQFNQTVIDSINQSIETKRLYVTVNKNKLTVNNNLKEYTRLLKQFLAKNPTKQVFITGHTDNKGYYQINLAKGFKKANLVKKYFELNGITNRILAFSRGEAEPIADKNTVEGKIKNNRIEIKIN